MGSGMPPPLGQQHADSDRCTQQLRQGGSTSSVHPPAQHWMAPSPKTHTGRPQGDGAFLKGAKRGGV